jgi:hypothetical protein
MKELPPMENEQTVRAIVAEDEKRQYDYPPTPKVICEDPDLVACQNEVAVAEYLSTNIYRF